MTKLMKMKKNEVVVGLPVKSLFSGSFGKVVMSPNSETNGTLIKWDNGSDSYGDYTKFKNIEVITDEEYNLNLRKEKFEQEIDNWFENPDPPNVTIISV